MSEELKDFALLHLNNLLIISIFGLFLIGLTFLIVRLLRNKNNTGPFVFYILKYTKRFNSLSIVLIYLLLYFLSQLLFIQFLSMIGNIGKTFVIYTSLIFSIIIGLKIECYFYKKKHPNNKLPKRNQMNIPVQNLKFSNENGAIYYKPGEERPQPWDNLSHNFWKVYNKKIMVFALLILLPILFIAILFVFIILIMLIGNIIISSIIMGGLIFLFIIYLVIKIRTFIFLSKIRQWEYTSLSHPNIPFKWMSREFSRALLKKGYHFTIKNYKMMGNRYIYHYLEENDVCVRLMYSNSPIPNEYTISIGPDNSKDPLIIEDIKTYLSKWGQEKVRPRIGYYKILDSDYLMLKDKSAIENHLKKTKMEVESNT